MSTPAPAQWYCQAYGPEPAASGALCFRAEPGQRRCADAAECARTMTAERQRVFRRINELAAQGDPDMAYLADEFASPAQILDADAPPEPQR